MKNTTLFLFFAFSFSCIDSTGQKRFDTSKYSIQLPDAWKGNSRLILAITDVIPLAYKELEDKQFCIDCDASRWVNFYVSEPVIHSIDYIETVLPNSNRTDIQCRIWYSFESFLDIYHINGTLLKRIVFTDTSERRLTTKKDVLEIYYKYDSRSIGNGPYISEPNNTTKSYLPHIISSQIVRKKMVPTNQELWNVFFDAIIDCRKKMNKMRAE